MAVKCMAQIPPPIVQPQHPIQIFRKVPWLSPIRTASSKAVNEANTAIAYDRRTRPGSCRPETMFSEIEPENIL